MKIRLDQLLVQRGVAESREKARRLILAGQIQVAGQAAPKPGHLLDPDHPFTVKELPRFVSRGGDKLEAAVHAFHLDLDGRTCLDIGSSTGGFTDCMLQHGAARVYAVDVGKGLLHGSLRDDPRVVLMEQVNARYLTPGDLPEPVGFATIDASFISLTLLLKPVRCLLAPGAELVSLIKPQFEAGRQDVSKGRGVISDPAIHQRVIDTVRQFGTTEAGLDWVDITPSPIKGPKGNTEFLALWRRRE